MKAFDFMELKQKKLRELANQLDDSEKKANLLIAIDEYFKREDFDPDDDFEVSSSVLYTYNMDIEDIMSSYDICDKLRELMPYGRTCPFCLEFEVHGSNCEPCTYGKVYGQCDVHNSKYQELCDAICAIGD